MGAACDLWAHKSRLCVERRCVDLLEGIPALVAVAVSAGIVKTRFTDSVLLHGMDHLELIVLGCPVKFPEAAGKALLCFLPVLIYLPGDPELFID